MVLSLKMGWRHLLFENWPVDASIVAAHLPDALDVDEHDGRAWLSVVPFTNVAVRPVGVPARLGVALPELNLRTYVTCDGEPGVYFFSLDAQGVLSVLAARLLQHLPYYYARIALESVDGRVRFTSRRRHPGARPADYAADYWPTGEAFVPSDDSLAAFLVERYRFYTQAPDGSLGYTDIDHDPWTLYPAAAETRTNTLFAANGFAEPESAPVRYYSPGLDVTATASQRWTTPE
ncbi:YqjF family protein [Haloplanus halobius]|uniref:YqjF family protein n=1 Tax=Haloplanus halobius TaxID=2934938 RepID=UPI00200BC2C4|nr:DUF2071 domain-containing protein [Haloplanus sp. XH21]